MHRKLHPAFVERMISRASGLLPYSKIITKVWKVNEDQICYCELIDIQ